MASMEVFGKQCPKVFGGEVGGGCMSGDGT